MLHKFVNRSAGILLGVWLLLGACSHDPAITPVPEPADGETQVTFSMQLPGNYAPQSKALDPQDETHVETVEVLVFEPGGNFKYVAYANDISVTDNNVRTFTVTLRTGTCDLMILANARQWLETAFSPSIPVGTTPQEIRDALVAQAGKWNATPGGPDYISIPMWGERKNAAITQSTSFTGSSRLYLTRMLARIDVAVHADLQADFKLKEIYLYNPYDKGAIIPSASSTVWDADENRALLPSIPDSWTSTGGYYKYDGAEITDSEKACKSQIYTFEAPAGTAANYTDNTCLVVGGEYKGVMGYYRLDFVKTASDRTVNYLPLLRNHIYTVTIQSIGSAGLSSHAEAFRSKTMNIDADIITRNDGEITHYVYDGQYYLGCDPAEAEFWSAAVTGEIHVTTDYPEEWTYTICENPDGTAIAPPSFWLTATAPTMQNGIGATDGLEYALDENDTGVERTAYIVLRSGRLTLPIKITQQPWYIESVTINPTGEILGVGDTRTVTIKGSFNDIKIRARNLVIGGNMDENIVSGTAGSTSSAQLVIPEFWEVGGSRLIAFEYLHELDQEWKIIRTDDQEGLGFEVEASVADGYQIARSRENLEFSISGNWSRVYIRAYDGTDQVSNIITMEPARGQEFGKLTMHKNNTPNPRNVYLQWSTDGQNWTTVFTGTQKGYFIDLKTSHTNGTNFIKYGGKVTVTIEGDYPRVWVRLLINGILHQTIIFEDENTLQSDILKLKNNPAAGQRPVSIEYALGPGGPWLPLCTGNQPRGFAEVVSNNQRRWIASADAGVSGNSGNVVMTWAEAMGIDPSWNSKSFFFQSYSGGESHNYNYPRAKNTGCNAYSEEIFGPGSWQLPGSFYMQTIKDQQSTHALNLSLSSIYWTATENAAQSYYWNMSNNQSTVSPRTNNYRVRCVMIPQDE